MIAVNVLLSLPRDASNRDAVQQLMAWLAQLPPETVIYRVDFRFDEVQP